MKQYSLAYYAKMIRDDTPDFKRAMVETVKDYARLGGHPRIAYEGPPPFFASALYAEVYRHDSAHDTFYPTSMHTAQIMADWLNIQPGMIVLDPGSGFGALSWAVQRRGGAPAMCEYAQQINELANAAWLDHGSNLIPMQDFLDEETYRPPRFDAAIVNPPFGRAFGVTYAEAEFLIRIADWSARNTPVCVILPQGYMNNTRPKISVEAIARYSIAKQIDLSPAEFKPLTNWQTTLYLLNAREDGRLFVQHRDDRFREDDPAARPIREAIERISAAGAARHAAAKDPAIRGLKPSDFEWMTDDERTRLSTLQAMLRTKSADEAKADVKIKRAARLDARTPPNTEPPQEKEMSKAKKAAPKPATKPVVKKIKTGKPAGKKASDPLVLKSQGTIDPKRLQELRERVAARQRYIDTRADEAGNNLKSTQVKTLESAQRADLKRLKDLEQGKPVGDGKKLTVAQRRETIYKPVEPAASKPIDGVPAEPDGDRARWLALTMTAGEARSFLQSLMDYNGDQNQLPRDNMMLTDFLIRHGLEPEKGSRRSVTAPKQTARQFAVVLWSAIGSQHDDEHVPGLYARHIWRETHDPGVLP